VPKDERKLLKKEKEKEKLLETQSRTSITAQDKQQPSASMSFRCNIFLAFCILR
jgi:hypothetical protein